MDEPAAARPQNHNPRSTGQAGAENRGDELTRVDVLLALVGIIAGLVLIVTLIFFAGFFLAPHGVWGGHAPPDPR